MPCSALRAPGLNRRNGRGAAATAPGAIAQERPSEKRLMHDAILIITRAVRGITYLHTFDTGRHRPMAACGTTECRD